MIVQKSLALLSQVHFLCHRTDLLIFVGDQGYELCGSVKNHNYGCDKGYNGPKHCFVALYAIVVHTYLVPVNVY